MVSPFLSRTIEHKEFGNICQVLGFTELLRKLICFGFYLLQKDFFLHAAEWSQSVIHRFFSLEQEFVCFESPSPEGIG